MSRIGHGQALPPKLSEIEKPTPQQMVNGKVRVCVTGAGESDARECAQSSRAVHEPGGFIAAHLAKRLKAQGKYVRAVDWKKQEFFENDEFCDEFVLLDLRTLANCAKATEGCYEVYNLAADMGGMGFIQSNHSVLFYKYAPPFAQSSGVLTRAFAQI